MKFTTDEPASRGSLLPPRLKAFSSLPLGIQPSSVCLGAVHGSQLYKNIYSSQLRQTHYSWGIQICSVNRDALTKTFSITGSHHCLKGRWLKLTKKTTHSRFSISSILNIPFFTVSYFFPASLAWFQLKKLKSLSNQSK